MDETGEGDLGRDALARRFRALFNRDPLSQGPSTFDVGEGTDEYEVDEEEVISLLGWTDRSWVV
jgi:hypothetical protein